jgi:hypothetical protein
MYNLLHFNTIFPEILTFITIKMVLWSKQNIKFRFSDEIKFDSNRKESFSVFNRENRFRFSIEKSASIFNKKIGYNFNRKNRFRLKSEIKFSIYRNRFRFSKKYFRFLNFEIGQSYKEAFVDFFKIIYGENIGFMTLQSTHKHYVGYYWRNKFNVTHKSFSHLFFFSLTEISADGQRPVLKWTPHI